MDTSEASICWLGPVKEIQKQIKYRESKIMEMDENGKRREGKSWVHARGGKTAKNNAYMWGAGKYKGGKQKGL